MLIERMTKLDKSSRNAVYAALFVITGIGMYGHIVSPHVQHLHAVQTYEPAIDKIIDKQSDIKTMLVARRRLLETLKAQFSEIEYTIFTEQEFKAYFAGMDTLAAEFGCSIATMGLASNEKKIIAGQETDPQYVECVETILTVIGTYPRLIEFIECLQCQERQVWLTGLNIDMAGETDTVLKCDINIKLYVLQKKKVEVVL